MSLAQFLSSYLNLNLLILIAVVCLAFLSFVLKALNIRLESRVELKLHYAVMLVVILLSVIHPMLPKNQTFQPAAKVWSAPSMKSFSTNNVVEDQSGYISLTTPDGNSTISSSRLAAALVIIGVVLFLVGISLLIRDLMALIQIGRESFISKHIGKARILISDHIQVPFSFWLPGQANIVLPSVLLNRRKDYQMVISHELQHHRQGDTRWVYIMWGLKVMCIINPAIHLWNRWISEIQEFACDETLVDQRKVDSQAYARCLVEVAQTAIDQRHVPVCATGLTLLIERNLLHRRIVKMISKPLNKVGRSMTIATGMVIVAMLAATAYASKGLVQDRRVSMADAKAMAIRAQSESGFPVVVNELVLKQLNRYLGTPEGREFMRTALARMENHKVSIAFYLEKYRVPSEILAVPIVESGYQNLGEQSNSLNKAAGLWQFIPQTARNYGLRVDAQKDERLDVNLLTDAAMRYLQVNNLRFKDWHLSLLAYNMGENAVQKGMNATGARDAWTLIRNGFEGDKDYLPKVMAAILIMKNPESVQ